METSGDYINNSVNLLPHISFRDSQRYSFPYITLGHAVLSYKVQICFEVPIGISMYSR